MDVVEVDNAIGWNTIVGRGEHELRYQSSLRSGQSGDDHGSNPVSDGIARQHQHRTIATGRRREPDLTSLHAPNRPSPQPDPNLRSPTEIARLGYRSVPVGEMRMDKKGRPRPEGYGMEIEPSEAATVLRIFKAYTDGQSLTAIVRSLNENGVPGRF